MSRTMLPPTPMASFNDQLDTFMREAVDFRHIIGHVIKVVLNAMYNIEWLGKLFTTWSFVLEQERIRTGD